VGVARGQKGRPLAGPGFGFGQVGAHVAQELAQGHLAQVLPLLVADQQEEPVQGDVAGPVAEVREADHRQAGQLILLSVRVLLLHLQGHVGDVGADAGTFEAPGVLPGHVQHLEAVPAGQGLHLGTGDHACGAADRLGEFGVAAGCGRDGQQRQHQAEQDQALSSVHRVSPPKLVSPGKSPTNADSSLPSVGLSWKTPSGWRSGLVFRPAGRPRAPVLRHVSQEIPGKRAGTRLRSGGGSLRPPRPASAAECHGRRRMQAGPGFSTGLPPWQREPPACP